MRWILAAALGLAAAAATDVPRAATPSGIPHLRVATPLLPPWAFPGDDCRPTGIAVENLRRLAAHAGLAIDLVTRPLETREDAFLSEGIDLFIGDAALNGPVDRAVRQPFGHTIETIVVGPGVRDGVPPADRPGLRIGARTTAVAAVFGYRQATVIAGGVDDALAKALVAGDIDLLLGGKEVVVFALLAQGQSATAVRRRSARLGLREVHYYLSPAAEARWGDRLRRAARELDWKGSERQLRERFLRPELAQRGLAARPSCTVRREASRS